LQLQNVRCASRVLIFWNTGRVAPSPSWHRMRVMPFCVYHTMFPHSHFTSLKVCACDNHTTGKFHPALYAVACTRKFIWRVRKAPGRGRPPVPVHRLPPGQRLHALASISEHCKRPDLHHQKNRSTDTASSCGARCMAGKYSPERTMASRDSMAATNENESPTTLGFTKTRDSTRAVNQSYVSREP